MKFRVMEAFTEQMLFSMDDISVFDAIYSGIIHVSSNYTDK